MKKIILIGAILYAGSAFGQEKQPGENLTAFKKALLNYPLKSFSFNDLTNTKWESGELIGKVVVINFWFTACKPCISEMPHLNKLVTENKKSPVVFIAPAPENETQLNRFLKKYFFEYHIIPSSLDYITALNVENFPTHLVVDQNGIIRQVFIGYADDIKERLQAEIDKLIK